MKVQGFFALLVISIFKIELFCVQSLDFFVLVRRTVHRPTGACADPRRQHQSPEAKKETQQKKSQGRKEENTIGQERKTVEFVIFFLLPFFLLANRCATRVRKMFAFACTVWTCCCCCCFCYCTWVRGGGSCALNLAAPSSSVATGVVCCSVLKKGELNSEASPFTVRCEERDSPTNFHAPTHG